MTRKRPFILIGSLVAVVAVVLVLALVLIPGGRSGPLSPPQRMPDGTTLTLTSVKTGRGVEFLTGTPWEKLMYHLIPSNGVKLAGRIYQRPKIATAFPATAANIGGGLYLEFKVDGTPSPTALAKVMPPSGVSISTINGVRTTNALSLYTPPTNLRLIVSGEDGFEFSGSAGNRTNTSGYRYFSVMIYPRQAKTLDIRLDLRIPNSGMTMMTQQVGSARFVAATQAVPSWKPIAHFTALMRPQPGQTWVPENLPARSTIGDVEIELASVTVRESQPTAAPTQGLYEAEAVFEVREKGTLQTGWVATPLIIADSTGNSVSNNTSGLQSTTGSSSIPVRLARIVDPGKVWRMQASLGLAKTGPFPASNLVSFTFSPPPIPPRPPPPSPANPPVVVETNFMGIPVRMLCTASMVRFVLPTNRPDLRIDVVKVAPVGGSPLSFGMSNPSEHETGFPISGPLAGALSAPNAISALTGFPISGPLAGATNFDVTLAIHPDYHVEFMFRPTLNFNLTNRASK